MGAAQSLVFLLQTGRLGLDMDPQNKPHDPVSSSQSLSCFKETQQVLCSVVHFQVLFSK